MAKNNYLTLTVRVCGTEAVNLISSPARFFIAGIEIGNVNTMADATRYIIIT